MRAFRDLRAVVDDLHAAEDDLKAKLAVQIRNDRLYVLGLVIAAVAALATVLRLFV